MLNYDNYINKYSNKSEKTRFINRKLIIIKNDIKKTRILIRAIYNKIS